MIEPYRMVFVNSIASLILISGLLFYRYIAPRKTINPLILLLLISLLPLISLLRAGVYESGDFSINIYKSMAFYSSLSEGNIIPHWVGNLNATFGYPLFIFTYPLPYYIISFFHFLNFSYISSLKLLLGTSFIASGFAMYLWIREEMGTKSALTSAIFYLYAPYHFVDTNFRISIGEIVSFVFLPLTLFFITKWMKTFSIQWLYFIALSIFFLLLCNPAISIFAFLFICLYSIFTWKERKIKKKSIIIFFFLALLIGLLLSAFYWMPVIMEAKYTHEALYVSTITFVQLKELIYSPWRYGLLFQGPKGQLSFVIGYIQLLVVVLSILFVLKNKYDSKQKKQTIFFIALITITIFLMLPYSEFIWNNLTLLKNFQFTYRLLLFVSLFISFLAGIIAIKLKTNLLYILCVLAILQTILNWGNRGTIPQINDNTLRQELPLSTIAGEGFQPAAPIWTDPNSPWQKKVPIQHLEALKGKAEIKEIKRSSVEHQYVVNVTAPTYFKENTLFFPDWTIIANNKVIPISYQNKKYPGIMTFSLNPGLYKIDVKFLPTNIQILSGYISGITVIFLVLSFMFSVLRYLTQIE